MKNDEPSIEPAQFRSEHTVTDVQLRKLFQPCPYCIPYFDQKTNTVGKVSLFESKLRHLCQE